MKTIQVQLKGTGYEATQFFFNNHKVTGIAEWYELPCEHEFVRYEVDRDGLQVECECELTFDERKVLLDQFNWDEYHTNKAAYESAHRR